MSTLVTPNTGEDAILNIVVNKVAATNLKLHLFKNNATISESTVIGDLTECDFTGYSAKTLTGASWSVSGSTASYAQQTYSMTSGGSLYGWYITNAASDTLIFCATFDSVITLPSGGGEIKVTPAVSCS